MPFQPKLLGVTFSLGNGTFGQSGQNVQSVAGLRMTARLSRAGGPMMSNCAAEIYGLSFDTINKLSTMGLVAQSLRRNTITIKAGVDASSLTQVYTGTITSAYGDFGAQPNVPLRLEASTAAFANVQVDDQPAISFKGSRDAADILQLIAGRWPNDNGSTGVPFSNNGFHAQLTDQNYYGSIRQQAMQCIDHAGCEWNGCEDGTFAIWPPGVGRTAAGTQTVPIISASTGMVGYPAYSSNGIIVTTLYNPAIRFGYPVVVSSTLSLNINDRTDKGPSTWIVNGLDYSLSTMFPSGDWFATVYCTPLGQGPSLQP